jgi:outer membrane autotransporter protein
MVEDARLPRTAVLDRLSQPVAERRGAWMQVFGNWGESSGDRNTAQVDRTTTGVLFGLDAAAGDAWRLGLAAGHTRTDLDVNARSSDGKVKSVHVLGYAGGSYGPIHIKAGLGYAHVELDVRRAVRFTGVEDSLASSYHGSVLQGFGELSFVAPFAGGSLEPFANISVVRAHTVAFSEEGSPSVLSAAKKTNTIELSTLGLRVATVAAGPIFVRATAGWQHSFGGIAATADVTFAGGSSFRVKGTALSRDSLVTEAELGWRLTSALTLGASYSGTVGERSQDHAVKGNVTLAF